MTRNKLRSIFDFILALMIIEAMFISIILLNNPKM